MPCPLCGDEAVFVPCLQRDKPDWVEAECIKCGCPIGAEGAEINLAPPEEEARDGRPLN
jgi:hypothetical protein